MALPYAYFERRHSVVGFGADSAKTVGGLGCTLPPSSSSLGMMRMNPKRLEVGLDKGLEIGLEIGLDKGLEIGLVSCNLASGV